MKKWDSSERRFVSSHHILYYVCTTKKVVTRENVEYVSVLLHDMSE